MAQYGVQTPEYQQFEAEGSGNDSADGMFSIQVRSRARVTHLLEIQIRKFKIQKLEFGIQNAVGFSFVSLHPNRK